jgi:DnaJ-class molecular chaperone
MEKSLYKILGVKKSAKLAEIKKAHRALSKKHHPDLGGDTDKFLEIDRAYKVLRDKDRRQHYDETGEIDAQSVLSEMDEVRGVMADLYQQLLKSGHAFHEEISIIDALRQIVKENRIEFKTKAESFQETVRELKALRKRITREDEGENFFAQVTDEHIAMMEADIKKQNHSYQIGGLVLDELQNYKSFAAAVQTVQMYVPASGHGINQGSLWE